MKFLHGLVIFITLALPTSARCEAYCWFYITGNDGNGTVYISTPFQSFSDWKTQLRPAAKSFAKFVVDRYPLKEGDIPPDQVPLYCPDSNLSNWRDRDELIRKGMGSPKYKQVIVDWRP